MNISKLLSFMEVFAPAALAEPWDNCGLLIDTGKREIHRVLLALDATEQVTQEAVAWRADLLITHHPIFLHGVQRLTHGSAESGAAMRLVRHNVSLFAAHTNLDACPMGINRSLCDVLGLVETSSLGSMRRNVKKLAVYVPPGHAEAVFSAMTEQGAGHIGNYSHCSYRVQGEGTFLPGEHTHPYLGVAGKLERAAETRIETIVPDSRLADVISAMLRAHPYEEPAYDVYGLELYDDNAGLGFIGRLSKPQTVRDLAQTLKQALPSARVGVSGDVLKAAERVAVSSGAGFSLFEQAIRRGADVFITGEAKHHELIRAADTGVPLIIAGHFETEAIILDKLIGCLQQRFDHVQYDVEFKKSGVAPPVCMI